METQDVMNLLTGGLGAATVWLAVETRRMASASLAQIELQSQPHLAFRGFSVVPVSAANLSNGTTLPALRLGLEFSNPGHVLITYEFTALNSNLCQVKLDAPEFCTRGGVVHPATSTFFMLPIAPLGDSQVLVANPPEFEFSVSFWAAPTAKKSLNAKVRLELYSLQPLSWQWVFLDGPNYA